LQLKSIHISPSSFYCFEETTSYLTADADCLDQNQGGNMKVFISHSWRDKTIADSGNVGDGM
jgi:hypothetical protein